MKKQTKAKKRNPRSEAAQREAIRLWNKCCVILIPIPCTTQIKAEISSLGSASTNRPYREIVAIFDLRDCYRKRAPIKCITKAVRKAIQPRRKKK